MLTAGNVKENIVPPPGLGPQPLVADRSDLGGLAVRHGVHQGADASLDEIDESDGLISTVERLPVFQRSTVKMRAKPFVVTGR